MIARMCGGRRVKGSKKRVPQEKAEEPLQEEGVMSCWWPLFTPSKEDEEEAPQEEVKVKKKHDAATERKRDRRQRVPRANSRLSVRPRIQQPDRAGH